MNGDVGPFVVQQMSGNIHVSECTHHPEQGDAARIAADAAAGNSANVGIALSRIQQQLHDTGAT